jgi:hypothetical protein
MKKLTAVTALAVALVAAPALAGSNIFGRKPAKTLRRRRWRAPVSDRYPGFAPEMARGNSFWSRASKPVSLLPRREFPAPGKKIPCYPI